MNINILGKEVKISLINLIVIVWIALLFLPRVVKKGLFGDGLLYASMARNMSIGKGDYWSPYFSSSYWIEGMPDVYYENPPLMIWVQSFFFDLLGDHWWVEKLFCLVILIINVLLMKKIWDTFFVHESEIRKYSLLPALGWYLIPVSIWGNVNNMMDNLLLSFCLLSIYIYFCREKTARHSTLLVILMALSIFGGILTKGPVALYVLALPSIIYFVYRVKSFRNAIFETCALLLLVIGMMLAMFYFFPTSKIYFQNYWEQRLKGVLTGERTDLRLVGWERIYILKQMCLELVPIFVIGMVLWISSIVTSRKVTLSDMTKKNIILFVLMGLAGTVPILLSSKQSNIYLIPGIPMFGFAFAIYFSTYILQWRSNFVPKSQLLFIILPFFLIGTIGFSIYKFGDLRRDKEMILDIEGFVSTFGKGHKIFVCNNMMNDFTIHTNLQRIGQYELTTQNSQALFALTTISCGDGFDKELLLHGFTRMNESQNNYFTLWQKSMRSK